MIGRPRGDGEDAVKLLGLGPGATRSRGRPERRVSSRARIDERSLSIDKALGPPSAPAMVGIARRRGGGPGAGKEARCRRAGGPDKPTTQPAASPGGPRSGGRLWPGGVARRSRCNQHRSTLRSCLKPKSTPSRPLPEPRGGPSQPQKPATISLGKVRFAVRVRRFAAQPIAPDGRGIQWSTSRRFDHGGRRPRHQPNRS